MKNKKNHTSTYIPIFRSAFISTLIIIAIISITSCSSENDTNKITLGDSNNNTDVALKASETKEAFEQDIKSYLNNVIEDQVALNSEQETKIATETASDDTSLRTSFASAETQALTADSTSESSISTSETNLVELGVDEADLIKSDGRHLFIGRQPKYQYITYFDDVSIRPAVVAKTDAVNSSASLTVEPYLPTIESPASIRIMMLDNETPESKEITQIELPDEVSNILGLYITKKSTDGVAEQIVVVTNSFKNRKTIFYQDNNIRIYSFDVSNPENPEKQWQMEIEGYYHASRSMNGKLYVVSTKYFRLYNLPDFIVGADGAEENKKLIENLTMEDILPTTWINEEKFPLVTTNNCLVMNKQTKARVYQPSLLTVFTIPIDQPKKTQSLCTMESSSEVYVSPTSIYFTRGEYLYSDDPTSAIRGKNYTVIHKLAFTEDSVAYKSSIRVPGWTGWRNRSFRMSEYKNDLRIVVTDLETTIREIIKDPIPIDPIPVDPIEVNPIRIQPIAIMPIAITPIQEERVKKQPLGVLKADNSATSASGNSEESESTPIIEPIQIIEQKRVHKLYVIRESVDNGQLKILSQLPNKEQTKRIGKPGEDIYSVRFFGDYAYIVTFRRTDPLYAINLKDPAAPFIEGELSIPGFSEYLHPISDDLLLGVGKDANRNGIVKGLKVALFDVSDKSNPQTLNEFVLGNRGSNTALSYDYKAFTIRQDKSTGLHRVSIPVSIYDDPRQNPYNSFTYYEWSYSGLQLFEVDDGTVSTDPSLTNAGTIRAVERTKEVPYYYSNQPRSLLVNDAVHYIDDAKVWSANWFTPKSVIGPK